MIDFPNAPTMGQVFNTGAGPIYQWDGTAWNLTPFTLKTADRRNRASNPSGYVSQENGTTEVTAAAAYAADLWQLGLAGIVGAARDTPLTVISPDGALYAPSVYAKTAKGSLAAGDAICLNHYTEGADLADLGWGTPTARNIVIRFNALATVAGQYGFAVRNGAGDRCWLSSFNVPVANIWYQITMVIPGDTTGTWAKDSTLGMITRFVLAAGTTGVGVPGWQAGNFFAPPGCINGAAQANQPLYITDLGIYADVDKTGIAPPWEAPDFAETLAKCQRYWCRLNWIYLFGYSGTGNSIWETLPLPVNMRITPTILFYNIANISNLTVLAASNASPTNITVTAQIVTAGGGLLTCDATMNARM